MFVDLDRRLHFEILKAFVPTHNVWGRPAQRATVRSGAVDAAVMPLVLIGKGARTCRTVVVPLLVP